ncbi:MAG: SDR family oxidoreductase [Pelagibaca sp.]
MQTIFIAGATGYLGRFLCSEYRKRGWRVIALVRDRSWAQDLAADTLIEAEATKPETLAGVMNGADLVISALGITRQADGLGYWDVDYQANLNLLNEARRAEVKRFAYIHVLNARKMRQVPLVAAKSAFVQALQEADIASTVIAPSGYFSDTTEFLAAARFGRMWLFGTGAHRINPIHGADLAVATADAIAERRVWLDVGGPDIFRQSDLSKVAFAAIGKPEKVTRLPDWLRRIVLKLLPRLTPRHIHGPAQFFLTAVGLDMVGEPHGTRHLEEHFAALANSRPS